MKNSVKNRILVTASTFPTFLDGDATPAFIYELTKRLTNNFDVTVLVPYAPGCTLVETRDGMEIIRFKYWPGKKLLADGAILPNIKQNKSLLLQLPFFFLFQLIAISKICRNNNIDLVHAHWIIPQGLTAAIYKQLFNKNIKLLVSSHGSDVFGLKGAVFSKIRNFIFSKCNRITVVGPEIKRQIEWALSDVPCSVIPMGLDMEKFRNDHNRDKVLTKLLFVGRLAPEKRILDLVTAIIKSDLNDVTLTIVGDGPEKVAIQELLSQHNVQNIVIAGAIPHTEIPKVMQQHDIFVLPSEREGMPVSLVEAMAAGMICIGSDIAQIKDVISPKKNGFLFEMGNIEDLIKTINEVLMTKDFTQIRLNSIRTSQKFDWDKIADQFFQEIQQLC